jgi:hypothetical protein
MQKHLAECKMTALLLLLLLLMMIILFKSFVIR